MPGFIPGIVFCLNQYFFMKLLLVFSFLFCTHLCLGQELIQDLVDPQYQNSSLLKLGGKEVKAPRWLDNFEKGYITLKSGKIIDNILLNIDTNSGNLITLKDGDEVVVNSKLVETVQFFDNKTADTLIFIQVTIPEEGKRFCEVIYDGKRLKMFKLMRATLKPNAQDSNTGYHADQPKEVFTKKTLYFLEDKSIVKEIKLNKKGLLQYFETIPGITELVKENKLNLNDVVDVKFLLSEIDRIN
jgi:hypothetical protein